ncbi:NAD(P)-binding protein [Hypoxylon sp. FL1284]|nr:NAD(P)-binding protein [Hypoxylon sp. FL1284]
MSSIFCPGNTAVITGGASGIGFALAKKCVSHGMQVLLVDWDVDSLAAAKESLGSDSLTVRMDVGRQEDWSTLKSKILDAFGGRINLLALNAGVGVRTSFDGPASDPGLFRKVIDTNLFGVVNGISALLPLIKDMSHSSDSRTSIVITGSKQGITNPPGNPAYNASKAAVKSVAEQLSFDLQSEKNIAVHLLVPGWTWTPLAGASSGGEKPDSAWSPAQVVDFLEEKVRHGSFWVLCPDNDVTEDMDKKRMLWGANDAVKGRAPLSRWRDEFKDEYASWMARDL